MDRVDYKIEILNICPDCGGDLDRNICDECKIKWIFALDEKGVEE